MAVRDDVWNRELSEPLPSEPQMSYLPVPWTSSAAGGASPVLLGGVGDVVPADDHAAAVDEPKPDALTQGWVRPPGGERTEALFVLAGSSMGIGRTERVTSPVWLDLNQLVHLDAIGDPVDGLVEVEITMDDDSVIGAGWSEEFCDAVVLTLTVLADRRAGTAPEPHAGEPTAPAAAEPAAAQPAAAEPAAAEPAVEPRPIGPVPTSPSRTSHPTRRHPRPRTSRRARSRCRRPRPRPWRRHRPRPRTTPRRPTGPLGCRWAAPRPSSSRTSSTSVVTRDNRSAGRSAPRR